MSILFKFHAYISIINFIQILMNFNPNVVLHPNPEGFIYMSWKERKGGGTEGRKQ